MFWNELLTAASCVGFLLSVGSPAAAQVGGGEVRNSRPTRAAGLRYELSPAVAPYFGQITKIGREGRVSVAPPAGVPQPPVTLRTTLVEGYYLGVVQLTAQSALTGARLLRVQVLEVHDAGQADLQVASDSAGKLKVGEFLMLFRPPGATTAQMKQLPDLATIEEAGDSDFAAGDQAQLAKSLQNLKQLGLALHNYHDTHGRFPPAVLTGPDGKPWHSWRVLLLPYLEQAALYNQYRFDEPWNGPHNKKLLEKIPAVYSDPIHGENPEHLTHYVAICGEAMAFDGEGVDFDGENVPFDGGRWMADFTDGTSNTLLLGPATPEQEIPWLKPADILVEDSIPALGKKGSFPLPYHIGPSRVAPFVRCDGSVVGLKESADPQMLYAALTRGGGEPVSWERFPTVSIDAMAQEIPVIYVDRKANGVTVKLLLEPAPAE